MTRIEKTLDESDWTWTRRACDSEATKMTQAHYWQSV